MKPAVQKKPLQSRHRVNANAAAAAAASGQPQQAPAVPRMLRRMTKQSFMDVDLQYLMKLDPTTPDPFENSSPVFDDPPSLFRPLPTSVTGGPVGTQQQWMSAEAIARLQQEQESLRVQYLSFLHQLNLSNPHGFLVHMNTFAAEFPQEFQQLQSYIRFQEQITNQQREEAKRAEEMRVYQAQLEERHRAEQEQKRAEQLWEMQLQEDQGREFRRSLEEWLYRRQQQKRTSNSFRLGGGKDDALDMADVLTIALQKDPMFVERMMANGGQGLDVMLTPAQQQEFWMFLEEKRAKELLAQEKKRQDMASAGFSQLLGPQSSSSSSSLFGGSGVGGLLSSGLFGSLTSGNSGLNGFTTSSSWGSGNSSGSGLFGSSSGGGNDEMPIAFPSQFQPPMTQEQYLKRNRGRPSTTNRR
ncbi:hypothetical protein BGZ97_013025 [Linnemannia gamsii]|jgi:hypothetical protein|uniref:Uncharacterized protein n=1 Tax=Linnemannia gamsii TaxID=64522 RepID=A0A9P6R0A1_9FUNG|nr:hypothetical protein BGZ97_013025 [Linnemannia gamsii]